MEEKEIINENEIEEPKQYEEYIETIAELKKNSVSKEKYEELEREKKGLIEALKSGQQITIQAEAEKEESIEELRKELYGDPDKPMKNIDYIEKTLKLRKKIMDDGYPDPFLPNGSDYEISKDDIETAEMIAQIYQECLDYADGDDQLFTNELMRRTKDDSPIKKAKIKK